MSEYLNLKFRSGDLEFEDSPRYKFTVIENADLRQLLQVDNSITSPELDAWFKIHRRTILYSLKRIHLTYYLNRSRIDMNVWKQTCQKLLQMYHKQQRRPEASLSETVADVS